MEIIKKNNNQSSKLAIGLLTFFVSIIALVEVFHTLSKWNNNKSEIEMKINNINEMIDVDQLAETLKNPEQVESMKTALNAIKEQLENNNQRLSEKFTKMISTLGGEDISVDLTEYKDGVIRKDGFVYTKDMEKYKKMLTFNQLDGMEKEKQALKELITFINYRKITNNFKLPTPKGVIFHGVPGTGKTTLARAFAKQTDSIYIELDGTNFQKYNTKEGIKMVDALFELVNEQANGGKKVVVCIDECENTWRNLNTTDNSTTRAITTKFKNSLTGLKQDEQKNIYWIGTTNHIGDIDDAILSRFPYKIEIKPLDLEPRIKYLTGRAIKNWTQDELIEEEAIKYLKTGFAQTIENYADLKSFRAMETLLRKAAIRRIAIETSKEKFQDSQKIKIQKQDLEKVLNEEITEIINRQQYKNTISSQSPN